MTLRLLGGLDPTGGAGIARDLATAFTLDSRLQFVRMDGERPRVTHRARLGDILHAAITATTAQGDGVAPRTLAIHPELVSRTLLADPRRDGEPDEAEGRDAGRVGHDAGDGAASDGHDAGDGEDDDGDDEGDAQARRIVEVTKIGLAPDALAPTLRAVLLERRARDARGLAPPHRIIVDPVLGATAGGDLGASAGVMASWLGLADLVTPNALEAAQLVEALSSGDTAQAGRMRASAVAASTPAASQDDVAVRLARLLAQRRPDGQVYVLLKGGHAETGSIVRDVLASAGGVRASFQRPRIAGPELRGTGCALATAIAVHWRGHDSLVEATQAAIGWLDEQRPRACPAVRSRAAAPRRQADERPVGVAAGEARREASSAPAWHLPISPDVQARVDAVLDVLRGETQPRPT